MLLKDLLNKIKWDKRENPSDYLLFYLDRVENKLKKLKFSEILRLEGSFMIIKKAKEETHIPLHRIREIRKKEKVVWRKHILQ